MAGKWCAVSASGGSALIDEGSGPPLVVFHGWNGSNHNVLRWLPALTPRFRVIVPDLPGCNGVPSLPCCSTRRSCDRRSSVRRSVSSSRS
ncbi:MAG: alpha/beta fold hydrolase [Chloroflexi bacterium]|nr:MAG: alpha/beta fold hydrolase [Chloroflexota bacterium]